MHRYCNTNCSNVIYCYELHRARTFGRGTVRRGTVRRKKNANFG